MILRQYLHLEPVIAASYLFGCGGRGIGAVVDPVEDIDPYLADAERHGFRSGTSHLHADHISGARRLADATGASYILHMGRTELATSAEEGARALFAAAQRLRDLPDYLEILPGAFAGSVCGRGLSGKTTSTIRFEWRFNRAFKLTNESDFIQLMLTDIPPAPHRAAEIRAANMGAQVVGVE